MSNHAIVVNSSKIAREGLFTATARMTNDVYTYRWLILRLIRRDIFAPFRQSILGVAWAVILPVIPVTAYMFLDFIRVLNVRANIPFALYAMIGLTLWMVMATGISSAMSKLQGDRGLLTKIRFPVVVSLVSGYGRLLFETMIRLVFVGVMFAWFGLIPPWQMVFLPLILLPLFAMGFGLGVIFAILNVVTRDVKSLSEILIRYGVFLCGAIFPLPETGVIGTLNTVNVFYWLVVEIRNFMVFGTMEHPGLFAGSALVAVIVFLMGVYGLHATERRIVALL